MTAYRATVTNPARTEALGPVTVEAEDASLVPAIVAANEGQPLDWFATVGLTVWTVEPVEPEPEPEEDGDGPL